MNKLAPYWKAIVGFVAPGAVNLVAALQDGSKGGDVITQSEWIGAGLACVITSAAVFAIPNKPKTDPQPPA